MSPPSHGYHARPSLTPPPPEDWMESETEIGRILAEVSAQVDERLERHADPSEAGASTVHEAMRYGLLAPGKRVRAAVVLLTTEALGVSREFALEPACAIEMVHAASLILDDLPSMDDALLRRGRPACHTVFGEDVSVLAAFGLVSRAFDTMVTAPALTDAIRIELVRLLSRSIGDAGLIAGQWHDLRRPSHSAIEVESVAREKTGSLFVASAEAGARVAGAVPDVIECVRFFGALFGLCFQALDDVQDGDASAAETGNDAHPDHLKATYVSVLGLDSALAQAASYLDSAAAALHEIGPGATPLRDLGAYLLASRARGHVRR